MSNKCAQSNKPRLSHLLWFNNSQQAHLPTFFRLTACVSFLFFDSIWEKWERKTRLTEETITSDDCCMVMLRMISEIFVSLVRNPQLIFPHVPNYKHVNTLHSCHCWRGGISSAWQSIAMFISLLKFTLAWHFKLYCRRRISSWPASEPRVKVSLNKCQQHVIPFSFTHSLIRISFSQQYCQVNTGLNCWAALWSFIRVCWSKFEMSLYSL